MPVLVVSPDRVPARPMPGRTLQWLIGQDGLKARGLSLAVMRCQPGSVVRPLHAHRGIEEVVYVAEGEGEAWVDGDTAPGDAASGRPTTQQGGRTSGSVRGHAAGVPPPSGAAPARPRAEADRSHRR